MFVQKRVGIFVLYDLITVQNQYQEHDAVEVLQVVLSLGGHITPSLKLIPSNAIKKQSVINQRFCISLDNCSSVMVHLPAAGVLSYSLDCCEKMLFRFHRIWLRLLTILNQQET
jgi:hypothetical protein